MVNYRFRHHRTRARGHLCPAARMRTRADLARTALGIIFATIGLVIGWIEVFWRHRL